MDEIKVTCCSNGSNNRNNSQCLEKPLKNKRIHNTWSEASKVSGWVPVWWLELLTP